MDYDFEVIDCEEEMKNYFRGVSGRHIKDTLILKLKNTGSKPWGRLKGSFQCDENQSNYFFETTLISEDIYPGSTIEIVLNFPRIEKNANKGNCFSSIQLVYKDKPYVSKVIKFNKNYDLFGNEFIEEKNINKEEENPIQIKEEKPVKPKEEEKKPFILPIREK